jgi:uracil-DNA glycosylase
LVVIAPAPRRHEDLQGRALAGGPRNVLDAAIIEAGVDPDTVRVTSVVRCRPPDDRSPSMDEVRSCAPHLEAELEMVTPEVIVTLGPLATAVLLGRPVPFDRVVGFRLDVRSGTTLIPTYHPLDVLRGDKQATNGLRRDLGVAAAVLDGRMKSGAAARDELRARLG